MTFLGTSPSAAPDIDLSDVTALVSAIVAALALTAHILFQILAARRERDKIRFGIVYEDRFRACKELYTRLSRLTDAVERYTDQMIGDDDRIRRRGSVEKCAEAFRRSYRQNDVILDEELASEVGKAWSSFKDQMYVFDDAQRRLVDTLPNQAREQLLGALKMARQQLQPHIRRAYGIRT